MKAPKRVSIELSESQFCALLTGTSYAVGAMQRDKAAIEGTIEWIAEANNALREALREAIFAQELKERAETKDPATW